MCIMYRIVFPSGRNSRPFCGRHVFTCPFPSACPPVRPSVHLSFSLLKAHMLEMMPPGGKMGVLELAWWQKRARALRSLALPTDV